MKKIQDPIQGEGPTDVVVRALVECPAGTVTKCAYSPEEGRVQADMGKEGGHKRYAYLPFPANYGCIPGTRVQSKDGGDGDPLDVFVLCEGVAPGTILDVDLIGLIRVSDEDFFNDRLIALPRDRGLRTLEAESIEQLPIGVVQILKQWILHHDPDKPVRIKSVKGPKAAWKAVEKWRVNGNGQD